MTFPHPSRPVFSRDPYTVFSGWRVGALFLSLVVVLYFVAPAIAPTNQPQTFPILCDVEGSAIIGLQWGLERSTDLKAWQLVSTVPAPPTGGTVAFQGTNDQPQAFYRVRTVYPP